ncbi:alpha/beta hydrolase [Paenibacillus sp. FSL M8-0334]|uniref:alpha/beta fold hydrolase n=1 Tax=Paenibacillus sp. FSL M8-0334 TaxID=2921623 RepID=UPI0030F6A711
MSFHIVHGYTPPIRSKDGSHPPKSIASMEIFNLRGFPQWVVLRGHDTDNPLLLFFHGGPGASQTGAQRRYLAGLEEKYTVVNWDYRGAGKNYQPGIPPETMTIGHLLKDARELAVQLLQKFGQRRLFVMGHSFGALFGLRFVNAYPELVRAYVGINQPTDRAAEEGRSYEWVYQEAEKRGLKKAVAVLERMGAPRNGLYKTMSDFVQQRKLLTKLGGVAFVQSPTQINVISNLFTPELSWPERFRFMKGFSFSNEHLWDEFVGHNLFEQIREVRVPVYFVAGAHDRICHDLIMEYVKQLKAPSIHVDIFEKSGHLACFEEPDRFMRLMTEEVLV